MKVAFILSKFPCYDEAFLLRELHGISRQTETVLFSLRGGSEPVLPDAARALMAR
ncbi:MAG: colanic acid biosynthesis glycosyltransferase WcaL, partial [Candidatus Omnitrophica bacterium]|nr:colanic acid biosynthesis glycosyltransferase WcaL [Candidatus Omnitrophota bacterium]